ncbi:MAG TPA: hypothetical protein VF950_00905 [Planctomycetota bacterium]
MGDEKKKSGGKKGGTLFKLAALVILVLIGAELFARMTSQYEWSPVTRVLQLLKSAR